MTVIAKNRLLKIAITTLVAIDPTNSPAGPGINAIGANANAVVSVDPNSGSARCLMLAETASLADLPFLILIVISSTMTIALSIKS